MLGNGGHVCSRLSAHPVALLRSTTSVLTSRLPLHDVRDAVALCGNVIARSRLTLSPDEHDDLLTYLVETAWKLSLRYEQGRGSTTTFAGWATTILRMRIVDWQREKYGRGYRPHFVSLDDPEHDRVGASLEAGDGDPADSGDPALGGLLADRDRERARDYAELGLAPPRRVA
jgi:DNA-directed RNA polymerase specialized sigma24 family protein